MRRLLVRALCRLFERIYRSRFERFEQALENPELIQKKVLRRILSAMATTKYGRCYGIRGTESVAEFRLRVPVVEYEELRPWVEAQAADRSPVLTPGRIQLFEKTSGSRGMTKWIPYNSEMLKTFENMFVLWCLDHARNGLKLQTGLIFFLITPKQVAPEFAPNGISVGMKDDSGYLGRWVKLFARYFLVETHDLSSESDFVSALGRRLEANRNLEVISVWSPSLLILVCESICQRHGRRISDAEFWKRTWPDLKLISCWDAAWAQDDANRVRLMFPEVLVQGKGLLATEGAMTIPLLNADGCLPLLEDLYFEFEDEDDKIFGLHEIVLHRRYRILLTSPNGFLRYRIGDRVEVQGYYRKTPKLSFVGRSEQTVDMVGEKMSSEFVDTAIENILGADAPFMLLVPQESGSVRRYRLLIESEPANFSFDQLAKVLERELRKQHHYRVARDQGQLLALDVTSAPKLRERFHDACLRNGMQLGQVKHSVLATLDQSRALEL